MPVATFGSANVAGSTGTSLPTTGTLHFFPIMSLPIIVPTTFTSFSVWFAIFSTPCFESTHFSSPTIAMAYSTSGFTHMFVTPNIVSGRSVAAGRIISPISNFMTVNSRISASPPSDMSVSDLSTATGPQLGQKGAKWGFWTSSPFSFNL